MTHKYTRRAALGLAAAFCLAGRAIGAEARVAVIKVDDMHCANCAKKIARKLYAVPRVTKVTTNVKAGTATIVGQQGKDPSPKALWEAVEQASFQPVKLTHPVGTFTKKPKV